MIAKKQVKRNQRVTVRLNEIEVSKLTKFAEQNGISVSEALRQIVQNLP